MPKEPIVSICVSTTENIAEVLELRAEDCDMDRTKFIRKLWADWVNGQFAYRKLRDKKGNVKRGPYSLKVPVLERRNLSMQIPRSLNNALQKEADSRNITKNKLMRLILIRYLNGELTYKAASKVA